MKAAFRALFLLILVGIFTTGCGGGDNGGKTLDIADIGWTENTAIAQLTKVLLEEQLGYEEVTVRTTDLDSVYDGVAEGALDAFQPACGCPTSAACSKASRTTSSSSASLTKARPNRA
jgi:ABC-type proline/glycine betaine transport system substrate-binding protein